MKNRWNKKLREGFLVCLVMFGVVGWVGEALAKQAGESAKQSKQTAAKQSSDAKGEKAEAKGFGAWRLNDPKSWFWFGLTAETGFLAVLSHKIQFGKEGTYFDYIKDGAQDNLFFYTRLQAEIRLFKRHKLILLYQPLDIRTQSVLGERLVQDQATFEKGEVLELRYGFDFYRLSYLYDFLAGSENELGIGLSLQIRNATIIFSNLSGTKRSYRNDIGPVPVLKARGRFALPQALWVGFEVDGFYAPISYLNGSDSEVVGAIVDASVRVGRRLTSFSEIYLNIRYIGGGAVGAENRPTEPGADGYVRNWIHLLSVSLGISLL